MSAGAQRIQDALRGIVALSREQVAAPPFTAYLDPSTTLTYLNYAIPEAGARAPWRRESIEGLAAAMAGRDRAPRLELVEECWPGLPEALVAAGFSLDADLLGMTCTPGDLAEPATTVDVRVEVVPADAPDATIRELLVTRREPFAELGAAVPVGAGEVASHREAGGGSVLARLADGTPAGAASWLPVRLGITEIVAVGVLAPFRGRGIAGALTAAAARGGFAAGAEVAFLTPGDDAAARVYERAGFRPGVRCVHLARPLRG